MTDGGAWRLIVFLSLAACSILGDLASILSVAITSPLSNGKLDPHTKMRWQILVSALAVCATAAQVPLKPLRPAQHDVLPGASLTADSQLKLSSIGSEFVEITHAAFPVSSNPSSMHSLR